MVCFSKLLKRINDIKIKLIIIYNMKQILLFLLLWNANALKPITNTNTKYYEKLSVKNLIKGINHNDFDKLYFSSDMKKIYTEDDSKGSVYYSEINPIMGEKLIDLSIRNEIDPVFIPDKNILSTIGNGLYFSILFYIFVQLVFSTFNILSGRGGGGMGMSNMIQNNLQSKIETIKQTNITLNDWAGSKEVIEECKEIITYLRDNSYYKNVNAEMPKGILLEGPPGTGKTLLAKAIANESNSTFISISGSEFVEVFVGVGAMRVRSLFEQARRNQPCIIFIDEIDAIGKQRGRGNFMGGNDEREQTLNQLLTEMDGFKDNDGVTIMAATNRKDVLDEALLRPGRFDRIVSIPLPDASSRKQILELYLKNRNVDKSVSIEILSKLTGGYSGAEIKNLINEAAINAARNKKDTITEQFINEAFEKLTVGIMKKTDERDISTKERVAIHETGHALLAWLFSDYFDLQKVSIKSSYSGVGGYTLFTEKNEVSEGGLYTKDMLIKRLMVQLGGKAAESVFYGDDFVSLGATMDLKQANSLAKNMIEKFGMGEKLNVFYKDEDMMSNAYSENKKYEIENESALLVNEAYSNAKQIIEKNKDKIKKVIELLMEKITIDYNEFDKILYQ